MIGSNQVNQLSNYNDIKFEINLYKNLVIKFDIHIHSYKYIAKQLGCEKCECLVVVNNSLALNFGCTTLKHPMYITNSCSKLNLILNSTEDRERIVATNILGKERYPGCGENKHHIVMVTGRL